MKEGIQVATRPDIYLGAIPGHGVHVLRTFDTDARHGSLARSAGRGV